MASPEVEQDMRKVIAELMQAHGIDAADPQAVQAMRGLLERHVDKILGTAQNESIRAHGAKPEHLLLSLSHDEREAAKAFLRDYRTTQEALKKG